MPLVSSQIDCLHDQATPGIGEKPIPTTHGF